MSINTERRQLKDTVLHLQAETGTTDQTNYGNDGTYNGGMGVTDGAFLFDGVDDYIDTPIDSEIDWGNDSWSVSCWAKIATGATGKRTIVGWGTGVNSPYGFWALQVHTSGFVYFDVYSGGSLTTTAAPADEIWFHVVVVYRSSTDIEVYVDGVSVGTSSSLPITSRTGHPLRIGYQPWNSVKWNGSIKDVRIISRAITATEIRELYNANARPDIDGTVLHLRPETGLVDQSGTQDPGSFEGNAAVVGRRFTFDGTGDYIDFGDTASLSVTGDLSVFHWIDMTDGQPASTTVLSGKWDSTGSNERSWLFRVETDGKLRVFIDDDGTSSSNYEATSAAVLPNGQTGWYHLGFVYDATAQTVTIYSNGASVASSNIGTIPASIYDSVARCILGGQDTGTGIVGDYDGDMGEVRIIPSAITAAQVLTLYEGVPGYEPPAAVRQIPDTVLHLEAASGERDLSNHCNYGTFTGTNIAEDSTDTEFVFNGTDDYIDCGDIDEIDGTSSFTWSCWFRPEAWANNDFVMEKGSVFALGQHSSIVGANGGFTVSDGAWKSVDFASSPTIGEWVHVAAVLNGASLSLYVDGIFVTSRSDIGTVVSSTYDFNIGGRGTKLPFNGSIDDVRLISRALSAGEISLLYNKGVRNYRPVGLLGGEVLSLFPSRHDVGVLPDTVLQLDGSTGVTDQSPAGNDGTLSGGASVVDGKFDFDGTDDYVESPAVFGGYPFTLAARFKTDTVSGGVVLSVAGEDTYYHSIEISGSNLRIRAYDGTSYSATGTTTLAAGVWYHAVAVFRSASDRELYLDGSSEATDTSTENGNIGYTKCRLGVSADTTPFNYFDGEIDDARLITRDVSATEVTDLYNQTIKDESGNGNDGTLIGGAYVGENDEIVFDGVDDYVSFTSQALTDFTLSVFFTADSLVGSFVSDATPTDSIEIVNDSTIRAKVSSSNYDWAVSALSTGTEYHLAVTRSSTTLTLYVDGVSQGTKTAGTAVDFDRMGVGFDGSVRDPRIFNRALTAAEVAFLASEHEVETPNTKGSVLSIVPSYDDWGNATLNAIDFSGNGNVGTLTNMTTGDWVADTDSGGTRVLDFDVSSDYVTASFTGTGAEGTVSTWVKFDALNAGTHAVFFSGSGTYVLINQIGSNVYWYWWSGSTTVISSSALSIDTWYHLLMTREGGVVTGYIDGALSASASEGGTWTETTAEIGGWPGQPTRTIDGQIDDVYVWDRALSLDEIKALASQRNYFGFPAMSNMSNGTILMMGLTH